VTKVSKKSFLLALDGSQEAMFAAEIAWRLAEAHSGKVLAQTVVDSQAVWQIVGKDLPGIIGNSPYIAAQETIHAALKNVAETLLTAYEARAQGKNIDSEVILDEGNVVKEIIKRAAAHDLVITGHRGLLRRERDKHEDFYFSPYSLAEHLAYSCPKPLLIIQDKPTSWKTARLVVSETTYSPEYLEFFLDLVKPFKVPYEIFCVGDDSTIDKFAASVRKSIPAAETVRVLSEPSEEGDLSWEYAADVPASTLIMVTTEAKDEGRQICGGADTAYYLRRMRQPALVILPAKSAAKTAAPSGGAQSHSRNK
jgi:nucleotide-binding universal stress UspA family protein